MFIPESKLSPWWLRAVVLVMVFGFAALLLITRLAYHNAPYSRTGRCT
jgi:nitric oxide reductase subunit B